MKNKRRFYYLLITIILIFTIFFLKNNWSKIIPQKSNKIFPDLKQEAIKEIQIETETSNTRIYKKDNRWFLKKNSLEYHADEDKINRIISAFINLEKLEVVSNNPDKFKDLGIDKQKVTLINNFNKKYPLYIGSLSSTEKNYLKTEKNNEVFLGEGFSNFLLTDDFRDLKIYLIKNEEDINFIEIEHGGKKIIINKKNQDWYLNDKKIKKEKVDFFINELATMKANDILAKDSPLPLILPELKIKVKEKNKEIIMYFIKKDENNYYLQIENEKNLYLISSFYLNSLKKEEKDFQDN